MKRLYIISENAEDILFSARNWQLVALEIVICVDNVVCKSRSPTLVFDFLYQIFEVVLLLVTVVRHDHFW